MRQLLKSLFANSLPKSLLLTHGRAAKNSGVEIALTFDDGPHPEQTPRLLDVLAEAGVRGTFFVVGERAEQHPHLIRRMADEGHELGNHTWTHSEPSQTSAAQFLDEVARTRRLIQDLTGRDCRLTRPPKGSLTIGKALGLWRQQQTIALWNIDPKDFAMADNSAMSQWVAGYPPQSGDIVLLHDNHSRAAVAVEHLAANTSLRFVTLSHFKSSIVGANVAASLPRGGAKTVWPLSRIVRSSVTAPPRGSEAATFVKLVDNLPPRSVIETSYPETEREVANVG